MREDMLWGFPKYKPGANRGTNFRTLNKAQCSSGSIASIVAMTTGPNGVVQPVHEQAMPVLLMRPRTSIYGKGSSVENVPEMQKPAQDDVLKIGPP